MPYSISMGIPMEIIKKFHRPRHVQFQSEFLYVSTALWFSKNFSQRLLLLVKNVFIVIFLFYRILHNKT